MRIIGGRHKGRKLLTPASSATRPTSDRAREALFNILGADIVGATFLDLFAGSGAVGLEAFSRGAGRVTLVEKNEGKLLAKNLERIGDEGKDNAELMTLDVEQGLSQLARRGEKYDIIFADPPWREGWEAKVAALAPPLMAEGGRLIVESYVKTEPATDPALRLNDKRRYGDTLFLFYEKAPADE